MRVSDTHWHENRNSEVKRFLKLIMSCSATHGTSAADAHEQTDWTDNT